MRKNADRKSTVKHGSSRKTRARQLAARKATSAQLVDAMLGVGPLAGPDGEDEAAAAELVRRELVVSDYEDQQQLTEKYAAERVRLDQALVDNHRALDLQHARDVIDLERRKLVELAQLWRRQGRQLGPGMLRALGEAGGADVST